MTIINARISRDEGIIATDTDAMLANGARLVCSKMQIIPHLLAVVAVRGQSTFLEMLMSYCQNSGHESFDTMLYRMPDHLHQSETFILSSPALVAPGGESGEEVFVAGWSGRQGRVIGRHFSKRGSAKFEETDTDFVVSPWDESIKAPKDCEDYKEFEELASAQTQWLRSTGAVAGGKLLVCRVTKDSISVTRGRDL